MKRTPSILWFLFIFILLALACGSEVTPTKVGEVSPQSPQAQPTKSHMEESSPTSTPLSPVASPTMQRLQKFQIGDVIQAGDLLLVVLGWEKVEGDEFTKPEEGKEFIAVDLIIANQGSKPTSISTLLQMYLKDETGQKYDPDLMAQTVVGSAPEGEISPGEQIRGRVGFQIPKDIGPLIFVFDVDVFGTGKVFVDLGSKPGMVEPPANLVSQGQISVYKVGDQVQIGNLILTVNGVSYPKGDQFNKPKEGYKFVVVDLTIENTGTESVHISSLLQMSLKDETGQIYEVDLMASVAGGGNSPEGEIAPGEKLRGQVGFQVPEDVQELTFVFDADVWGYGKVFVSLTEP